MTPRIGVGKNTFFHQIFTKQIITVAKYFKKKSSNWFYNIFADGIMARIMINVGPYLVMF